MIFDRIEWDEGNLDHIYRLTQDEIAQAIWNADRMRKHRYIDGRGEIQGVTDGGKRVMVIVQILDDGVRPITAWEE